jgi:protein involved in polysaccharide export with SLBB domain
MNLIKTCNPVYCTLLATLLFSIFPLSCARYPTIPKIEETPSAQTEQTTPEQETIGDVFKKKAASLIPSLKKEDKDYDYEIGPEDVLEIMVWDHDDLSREVCVSREGEFSYPLIGKVRADDFTVSQL